MAHNGPLGRRAPEDWEHYDKYPLRSTDLSEITTPRPIVIGVNWYTNFDTPRDEEGNPYYPGRVPVGNWWIGRGDLGSVRGGHCVCLKQKGAPRRPDGSWKLYDQGREGACVGFGASQMMSQMNRRHYFARWLWDRCKEIDYWSDTNPGDNNGTSVKASLDILRTKGHILYDPTKHASMNTGASGEWVDRAKLTPTYSEGIRANRWITSMDDCLSVLGYTGLDYVDIMNSWGRDYPRLVRMPVTTLERLWREDGEFGVPTDR